MGWSTHEMEVEGRPDQTVGMVNTRDVEVEVRPESWDGQHTRWK